MEREKGPQQRLGIRANLGQFLVQTLLVFFVGITVGLERNVVPVLAQTEFAIAATSVILSFVVSFGFVKALLNLYGGSPLRVLGATPPAYPGLGSSYSDTLDDNLGN